MSKALEVSNLNKSFGRFRLKGVSLALEFGRITGFVGANGAGKTTTTKPLLDLLKKDSGQIRYFGEGSGADLTRVKNRWDLSWMRGCLHDYLTITEMKNLVASAYSGWDGGELRKRLGQFSLDPKHDIRYAQREHIRGKGPMAVIGSGVRIAGARFRCRYHGAYRKATMYRPPPFPGEAGGGWPALSTRRLSYRRILNTFLGRPRGKGCSTPALTASPADESLCSILLAVRSDTPIASRSSLAVVVSRPSPRMIP